jgi:prevent-host-death family protein
MKTATIDEAKEQLEDLIAAARAGETVEITDAGSPVVALMALKPNNEDRETVINRLENAGLVRRNPRMPDADLLARWGLSESAIGLLESLLDEREETW